VRLLLDQNLSPDLTPLLQDAGHDAVHVRDLGLSRAADAEVLRAAAAEGRILLSSDTDFGDILARENLASPSVLLLRRQGRRRAAAIAALIIINLDVVADDLDGGAVVVFDGDRIRIRRLPMDPDQPSPDLAAEG